MQGMHAVASVAGATRRHAELRVKLLLYGQWHCTPQPPDARLACSGISGGSRDGGLPRAASNT